MLTSNRSNTKRWIALTFALSISLVSCNSRESSLNLDPYHFDRQLLPLESSAKWGYVDRSGRVVIPPKYDEAAEFSNGYAVVTLNKKSGVIDKTGKLTVPLVYDTIIGEVYKGVVPFCSGNCSYDSNDGRWGFLRVADGSMVVHPKYGDASAFSEDLAPFCIGQCHEHSEGEGVNWHMVEATGKWGFVDLNGKEAIAAQFDKVTPFFRGVAAVTLGKSDQARHGYIDTRGSFIVGPSN